MNVNSFSTIYDNFELFADFTVQIAGKMGGRWSKT